MAAPRPSPHPAVPPSNLPAILAVSSPPGRSARGIIRVSGEKLAGAVERILQAPPPPHALTVCRLREPPLPVLALYAPAPASYTGEDVLEIQVPGNPALMERLLHGVLEVLRLQDPQARFAEPGEFTHRAFMAGRIDLTRAEGIAATIGAVSDAQLQAARLLRTGRLGRWAEACVDRLAHLLALVEAGIDFVDQDDVVAIAPGDLDRGLASVAEEVAGMLDRSRSWSALEALPWVVLAGRPNAGKSTLFNALLGRDRAVTGASPGTTRDVLAEPLRITGPDGRPAEVMLVDVAGLDPSEGMLNRAMQAAAHDALARAELILLLHDPGAAQAPLDPPQTGVPVIHVRTKADLHPKCSSGASGSGIEPSAVAVSAVSGAGIDGLRRRIAQALNGRAVALGGEMLALAPRHRDALTAAAAALRRARGHDAPELAAESMRVALDHLGALGGRVTADDVIGRIFSTFCIGK